MAPQLFAVVNNKITARFWREDTRSFLLFFTYIYVVHYIYIRPFKHLNNVKIFTPVKTRWMCACVASSTNKAEPPHLSVSTRCLRKSGMQMQVACMAGDCLSLSFGPAVDFIRRLQITSRQSCKGF